MSKVGVLRGRFNLITANHVRLIQEASMLVDDLYVFFDTDHYMKEQRLRGGVLDEGERSVILSSIKGVDKVFSFDSEEEFYSKAIKYTETYGTKVYFKGGDYSPKDLKEADQLKNNNFIICCLTHHDHRHAQEILDSYVSTLKK